MIRSTGLNIGLAKVAVHCFADTIVVNQTLFLHINISGGNRQLRHACNVSPNKLHIPPKLTHSVILQKQYQCQKANLRALGKSDDYLDLYGLSKKNNTFQHNVSIGQQDFPVSDNSNEYIEKFRVFLSALPLIPIIYVIKNGNILYVNGISKRLSNKDIFTLKNILSQYNEYTKFPNLFLIDGTTIDIEIKMSNIYINENGEMLDGAHAIISWLKEVSNN